MGSRKPNCVSTHWPRSVSSGDADRDASFLSLPNRVQMLLYQNLQLFDLLPHLSCLRPLQSVFDSYILIISHLLVPEDRVLIEQLHNLLPLLSLDILSWLDDRVFSNLLF